MPQRDRAAVHVELRLGDRELAPHALDAAERLVDLVEVHVADAPAGLLEAPHDRAARRGEEQLGLVRELPLRDDPRERRGTELGRALARRDDDGRAAVVELRGVARGDRAAGLERGLERREALERRLARRL